MAKRPEVIDKLKDISARAGVNVPWDRITINRWRPDTCGCSIEQWFDDDADPRVVLYANILETCPEHAVSAPGEALWNTLRGENSRKNTVLRIIENETDEVTREQATWAFTSDRLPGSDERVLEVGVPGTTGPRRTAVQADADLQFGTGSVVVGATAVVIS